MITITELKQTTNQYSELTRIIENQQFKTEFEMVMNRLNANRKERGICQMGNGISVNKKLGLPISHDIGFLIAYYNEL
jgi:hypothetical protein